MAKRKSETEVRREYEEGVARVDAYIQHRRALAPDSVWADPMIPYYRMLSDFWADTIAEVKRPPREDYESYRVQFEAEVEQLCTYGDISTLLNDFEKSRAVATLLLHNDLGTVDIELLDSHVEGDGELAENFYVFRAGDRRIYGRGTSGLRIEIIDAETILSAAENYRAYADNLTALVAP